LQHLLNLVELCAFMKREELWWFVLLSFEPVRVRFLDRDAIFGSRVLSLLQNHLQIQSSYAACFKCSY